MPFISSISDYRAAAEKKLPRFLFDYIDGGADDEITLRENAEAFQHIALRQRVLRSVGEPDLNTKLLGQDFDLPVGLGPVGITGMYARRGEVQAARAAKKHNVPYTLSSVAVCSITEVAKKAFGSPSDPESRMHDCWFQLYVLKDRGFMKDALTRAWDAGVRTLVFTVDMPTPGARYRDVRSGMAGPYASIRRYSQAVVHPRWAFEVGIFGRPLDLGNVSAYRGKRTSLEAYSDWLADNFDSSIGWKDLEWIRSFWKGKMVLKGILDPEDAKQAVKFGADGIMVSNHGGRQLDGVLPTAYALPKVADAVKGEIDIIVDSGIRNGLDVLRALALGADMTFLGRAYIFALAAKGQAGVDHVLDLMRKEIRIGMILTGAKSLKDITRDNLASLDLELKHLELKRK